MVSVWARSTRAPQAQPVIAMIRPISTSLVAPEGDRKPKITMSSGSAGMTRKKLASMDSRSSAQRPCRYPALTPTSTDSTVAAIPARNATRIVLRPPASSCENTSCCVWVVPSQCAADGGCGTPLVVDELADGLYGATMGPMMATIRNTASMASPAMILGERGSRIRRARRAVSACGCRGPPTGSFAGLTPPDPEPPTPRPPRPVPPRSVPVPIDIAQASWRVRGSRSTYTESAARFASSTANVMIRKMPWSSG